jgi:hypothetical protein
MALPETLVEPLLGRSTASSSSGIAEYSLRDAQQRREKCIAVGNLKVTLKTRLPTSDRQDP